MRKCYILGVLAISASLLLGGCGDVTKDKNFAHGTYEDMPIINQQNRDTGLWVSNTSRVAIGDIVYIDDDFITVTMLDGKYSFLQCDKTRKQIKKLREKGCTIDVGSQVGFEFEVDEKTGILSATSFEVFENETENNDSSKTDESKATGSSVSDATAEQKAE